MGKSPAWTIGEERHPFGEAVDRRAPGDLEQEQDRRDERPGVPNPNPPDEVDDREGPGDRDVVPPEADARRGRVGQRREEGERAEPGGRERVFEARPGSPERREELVGQLEVAAPAEQDGLAAGRLLPRVERSRWRPTS